MSNALTFRSPEDWFTVEAIRTLPDPSKEIERRELVISLRELPYFHDDVMHLGPNPRRANSLNSQQRGEILESLDTMPEQFHHLNRGLTVVAKKLEVDDSNKSKTRVRLHLAEDETEAELFGLLDGGHTNEIVNNYRKKIASSDTGNLDDTLGRTFVNVQVLIPHSLDVSDELATLLRAISRSRNNNVQVKQRDLENLAHEFDLVKLAIEKEPYSDMVRWRDSDESKPIDGQTLLILMMMFHEKWVSYDDDPVAAYGQKGLCLDAFKEQNKETPVYTQNLIEQLPTLLKLFDAIEREFPDAYNAAGGKFGRYANVKKYDSAKGRTQLQSETEWKYTTAWIYPLFAGFRALLKSDNDSLAWITDPVEFWAKNKVEIVKAYMPSFKPIASATATKVGRNVPAFQICRMTVRLLASQH